MLNCLLILRLRTLIGNGCTKEGIVIKERVLPPYLDKIEALHNDFEFLIKQFPELGSELVCVANLIQDAANLLAHTIEE
jgi:hypothetical protein